MIRMTRWFRRFRAKWARQDAAKRIDLEAGVLEECPVCRNLVDKQHDDRLPIADQIAKQRVRDNDPSVAVFDGDLAALQRQLRDVRDAAPYTCICEDAG
jgi:hypothetical protein